jgi:phosphoribosylaminoimidazolecarboxamide formyltransferase/IMP cyclohydrolase
MSRICRALISVSDKTGLLPLCHFLKDQKVEIISTGGTAKNLKENKISTIEISDFTGFPEMLDGRVKTLHPKVHGGLLGLRDNETHQKTMEAHGILPIDLLIVNLYPFEEVSKKPASSFEEILENIDIGGPSMLRSAAKNFKFVAALTHPNQYESFMNAMKENDGMLPYAFRKDLAQAAFALTSHYDVLVAAFLKNGKPENSLFPQRFELRGEKVQDLRYGENPHQKAACYKLEGSCEVSTVATAKKLQGKELSFNNILDFDAAIACVKEFPDPVCVIVKHTNPCGVSVSDTALKAFERAWAADSSSAFGSLIAFNREIDTILAKAITTYFVEGVIAPSFSEEALKIFQTKKNIRLLELPILCNQKADFSDYLDIKKIVGGFLVQERDLKIDNENDFKVVTQKSPSSEQIRDLCFAWKVVKHVRSNAIVYAKNLTTVGIGAGQMSRVDSAKIGVFKAKVPLEGAVLGSDAFFPFRDGVDAAAGSGIKAIVQPGGSLRDREVIDACNEHGIAMVFTGTRHFRH